MIAAVLCVAFAVGAQAGEPYTAPERMGRAQAIQLGLERNQGLLTERIDRRRAEVLARSAWQPWSPALFADTAYRHTLSDEDRLVTTLGASWQAIVGTRVDAAVGVDQGVPGKLPHEPVVLLAVEQPLLKGGWLPGASLPLTEAQMASRIADELYRNEVNAFVVDVDGAYWDLGLAEADLEIKTRSRQRAQAQYEDTQENIKRGILADAEIYVVEENLVIFQQEHLRAEQRLRTARRRLAQLLYLEADAKLGGSDVLELSGAQLPSAAKAVEVALQSNPRLLAQRLRLELARERVRFHVNQTLPELSLASSIGLHGSNSNYGAAWESLAARPAIEAQVGARLTVPLDRVGVDSQLDAAELEEKREEAELARQENAVRFEVQNAVSELATDMALALTTQRQLALAELKLQAETDKYRSGLSTLSDVVRFQRDLDDASIAAKRVVRAVRTGETKLLASVGTLHTSFTSAVLDEAAP